VPASIHQNRIQRGEWKVVLGFIKGTALTYALDEVTQTISLIVP
jgi:hypothetical protein